MTRKIIGCILFIMLTVIPVVSLFGQTWNISGTVADSVTRKPLAFVALRVNNSYTGVTTDIDGKFSLKSPEKPRFLSINYVGYIPKTVFLNDQFLNLEISISSANNVLKEVVILPGENPAYRIILKALENRKKNDPEEMKSFRYKSYNKITAEWLPNANFYAALEKWKTDSTKVDSIALRLMKMASKQYILMMESYTQRSFLFPGKSKETVLGTKVSGFNDPNFASLATDIQPFSFYHDMISIKLSDDKDYLNPIARGSIGRYSYLLEDTLFEGQDSIYIISFHPLKGKTFNALKGVIYINTNGYAIQNVIAEPSDEGLWKIRIQQQYRFVDGSHWFPEQLNYDWILPKYPTEKIGVMLKGRSYIEQVELDPVISAKEFGPDKVVMTDSAGKRDNEFWQSNRPDTLNRKEKVTYVVMDSLGKKEHFDYYTRLVSTLLDGFIPIGPIDFSYDRLYGYNDIEGHHFGLGLRTNKKILSWFTIGGYFSYGLGDKRWKYGGDLKFTLWKKHDLAIYGGYFCDFEEPGISSYYKFRNESYWWELMEDQFDFTNHIEAGFRFRTFKYLEGEASLHRVKANPLYTYEFINPNGGFDSTFNYSEVRLSLKYSIRDEITDAFGERMSLGTRFPVFYFTLSKGLKGFADGEFNYTRLEFAIKKDFIIKILGTTSLLGEVAMITGNAPYTKLFRGRGSFDGDVPMLISNTFQTMRIDEFAGNKFASLFFSHNFGSLLFKAGSFRPEISIANNIYFSWLDHAEQHKGINVLPADKGYYEAGLIIDDLIKIKLLNIVYLGLGGGAFYRYGPYTFTNVGSNFAYKFSIRLGGS